MARGGGAVVGERERRRRRGRRVGFGRSRWPLAAWLPPPPLSLSPPPPRLSFSVRPGPWVLP
jgi:hypothetical protein